MNKPPIPCLIVGCPKLQANPHCHWTTLLSCDHAPNVETNQARCGLHITLSLPCVMARICTDQVMALPYAQQATVSGATCTRPSRTRLVDTLLHASQTLLVKKNKSNNSLVPCKVRLKIAALQERVPCKPEVVNQDVTLHHNLIAHQLPRQHPAHNP